MWLLAKPSEHPHAASVIPLHGRPPTLTFSDAVAPCCLAVCLPQDAASQSLGTFTAVPESGAIPAKGSKTVTLSLQAARLGRIQLPVYIRVAGSRNKPLQLVADAKAKGPWLELAVAPKAALVPAARAPGPGGDVGGALISADGTGAAASTTDGAAGSSLDGGTSSLSALPAEASSSSHVTSASGTKQRTGRKAKGPKEPQWAAAASISFNKVQVLQPHTQQLLLRNPTLIDAEVKLFVEGRDSVFEVRPVAAADGMHQVCA